MVTLNRDVLAKLRTIDTPTICNLIEVFDVRLGIRVSWTRVSGLAFPRCRPWWDLLRRPPSAPLHPAGTVTLTLARPTR